MRGFLIAPVICCKKARSIIKNLKYAIFSLVDGKPKT